MGVSILVVNDEAGSLTFFANAFAARPVKEPMSCILPPRRGSFDNAHSAKPLKFDRLAAPNTLLWDSASRDRTRRPAQPQRLSPDRALC
jgi:hypothetical protein